MPSSRSCLLRVPAGILDACARGAIARWPWRVPTPRDSTRALRSLPRGAPGAPTSRRRSRCRWTRLRRLVACSPPVDDGSRSSQTKPARCVAAVRLAVNRLMRPLPSIHAPRNVRMDRVLRCRHDPASSGSPVPPIRQHEGAPGSQARSQRPRADVEKTNRYHRYAIPGRRARPEEAPPRPPDASITVNQFIQIENAAIQPRHPPSRGVGLQREGSIATERDREKVNRDSERQTGRQRQRERDRQRQRGRGAERWPRCGRGDRSAAVNGSHIRAKPPNR